MYILNWLQWNKNVFRHSKTIFVFCVFLFASIRAVTGSSCLITLYLLFFSYFVALTVLFGNILNNCQWSNNTNWLYIYLYICLPRLFCHQFLQKQYCKCFLKWLYFFSPQGLQLFFSKYNSNLYFCEMKHHEFIINNIL